MFIHFIITGSDYHMGKRIALHRIVTDSYSNSVQRDLDCIKHEIKNLQCVSSRMLITESTSWNSVVQKEPYFKDVVSYDSVDEFISVLKQNMALSSLDIAQYVLYKCNCVHLKLQKLLYLCHAEYLCAVGNPLFRDRVCAFDKGPVCYDTYKAFKSHMQYSPIAPIESESIIKSRILSSSDGIKKLEIIDAVLDKYKDYDSDSLVDITHSPDSPWSKVYKRGAIYKEIPDSVIFEFHKNEIQ